jgi:hypothetical protein
MKRLHGHARWRPEDRRADVAIWTHRADLGRDPLDRQVHTAEELMGPKVQLRSADACLPEEMGTTCCSANSDKYWATGPRSIPWETLHPPDTASASSAPMLHRGEAARSLLRSEALRLCSQQGLLLSRAESSTPNPGVGVP